jgi:hypothetical protein
VPVAATSVRFADAARRLAAACRTQGLVAPGFRSPPTLPSALRTLRRSADGGAIVAVRVRGRPLGDVLVDMVEGVVVVNRLGGEEAESVRAHLLAVLDVAVPARAA